MRGEKPKRRGRFRFGSSPWQVQHEPCSASFPGLTPDPPIMPPRDLTDQRKPEADAALGACLARRPVEGIEDPLPFGFGNAGVAVGDDEVDPRAALAMRFVDLYRRPHAETVLATSRRPRVSASSAIGHTKSGRPERAGPVEEGSGSFVLSKGLFPVIETSWRRTRGRVAIRSSAPVGHFKGTGRRLGFGSLGSMSAV